MVNNRRGISGIVVVMFSLLYACSPVISDSAGKGISSTKDINLDPKLQFYRPSRGALALYYSIKTSKLLYARSAGEGTPMQAHLKVTCYGFDVNTQQTTWEVSKEYFKIKRNTNENWIGYLDLSDQVDYTGRVVVKIEDVNRTNTYTAFSNLSESRLESQYFLALDPATEQPNLDQHYFIGDSLKITYSAVVQDKVWINFFEIPTVPPPPPFYEKSTQDPMMEVRRVEVAIDGSPIQLPAIEKETLIEVKSSKNSIYSGLILPFFYEGYPRLTTGKNMIDPLVYISTKEEYEKLKNAENPRKAAENFWLTRCKNKEQARDVLGAFYKRVEESNKFFTYYGEGWKSDRGMVYIIFGKPESVTKRGNEEIWIYGREINTTRLSFTFSQQRNNFSFNHFTLERNSGYRATWDLAINSWRNGRPFSY